MLPPKKNQAARGEGVLKEDRKEQKDDVSEDIDSKEEDSVEYKNVFAETIMQGKRKHFVPKGKQVVEDWLSEHFEEKEGRKCPFTQVYSAYLQLCIEQNLTDAISEQGLAQMIKSKFPQGFVVQEQSGLKGKIKDHPKTPKSSSSSVSQKYKMKDVIKEAFEDLKDPIKGTGRAGRYRWYNPDRKEEEKTAKKKKKVDEEEKGEEKQENGEPVSAESAQEEEVEKKGDDDADATEKKPKAKKRAKKRVKKPKKSKLIVHSNPTTIEETFPLAFTFMAEPKEARVHGIVKYLEKHYGMASQAEKIIKVLDSGTDKGYWHLVQGNNRSGLYQLAVEEFDPADDDDLIGKIINAIMASVDPKTCSARALKEYLLEFHPEYKISERPYLFKRSLERAVNKGVLRQLTGIGASGTFQLVESFIPSPIILAGKDSTSDYEVDSSDEEEIVTKSSSGPPYDMSYFQDAYKPRPSKRRGMSRQVLKGGGFDKNAAYYEAQVKQATVKTMTTTKRKAVSKPKQKSKVTPKKRARYASSSEDEPESSDEEDSTYGSEGEKYVPRPSSSRGGGSRSAPKPKQEKKAPKSKISKTPAKKGKPKTKKPTSKGKPETGKKVKTERKGTRKSRR